MPNELFGRTIERRVELVLNEADKRRICIYTLTIGNDYKLPIHCF